MSHLTWTGRPALVDAGDVRANVYSRRHRLARRPCGRRLWICVCASCTNCRTGLRPKEWPMCTRCHATTCTTVATEAIRASGQARDICHEVRELALAQWAGRIGRLSRYFVPRTSCEV